MPAKRPVVPLLVVVSIALACVLPATPALAQATRGQLLGTISDQSARRSAWRHGDSHRNAHQRVG